MITYKDIAKKLEISTATVSLAMNNHPRISQKRRNEIKKMAEEMGYIPNPAFSKIRANSTRNIAPKNRIPIAWVNVSDSPDIWMEPNLNPILKSAKETASKAGYYLDFQHIPWSGESETGSGGIASILNSRGIQMAIFAEINALKLEPLSQWKNIAMVNLNPAMTENEGISHILHDDGAHYKLVKEELLKRKIRRVGLVLEYFQDITSSNEYSAQHYYAIGTKQIENIPPLIYSSKEPFEDKVIAYVKEHSLEAIICRHRDILPILNKHGYDVPGDISLIHLNIAEDVKNWAGININMELKGQYAVEEVIACLHRNQYGFHDHSKLIMIPGQWQDGDTMRYS